MTKIAAEKCGTRIALSLACAFIAFAPVASAEIVWRESFEDSAAAARWQGGRGFKIVDGVGLGGGRCMVWEEAQIRDASEAPACLAPVEGNAVRPAPPSGGANFIREFPVEPGRHYAFSVKINGGISNDCAYVFLRWCDKDGKMLGRCEGQPTIYKEAGKRGWETVKAVSQRLPSDAVKGEIYVEVYRSTLGRMCFDDFEITCDERLSVERIHSSAYRDAAAEGPVRFVVPYSAARGVHPPSSLSGEFIFTGAKGEFTVFAEAVLPDRFEVSVDVIRLALGTHPVRATLRHGDETLGSCEMSFTREEGLSTKKVYFDSFGRMIVEGKPFFPIGVYVHPRDEEVKYLNRLKGSPFNCVIESRPQKKMLDLFHSAGLMVLPKAPWKPEDACSVMSSLRNHPALLAWYVIDETPAERAEEEIALQKIRREADPDHPTFAVLDYPRNADAFMGAFDVLASDPYPIGYRRQPISIAADYPVECRKKTYGIRPLWQVPQSFAWDWCHKRGHPAEDRYPTYEELRSMAWQAVAGGANGLLWYSAHHIFKSSPPDKLEENWSNLVKVADEVKAHVNVLLSDEIPPSVTTAPDAIAARVFRKSGKTWLLVANKTKEPAAGEVAIAGFGKINVSLPPLGVDFKVTKTE